MWVHFMKGNSSPSRTDRVAAPSFNPQRNRRRNGNNG